METFRNWCVPDVVDLESKICEENVTQDKLCEHGKCEEEGFDCGRCLFSSMHCPLQDFKEWKSIKIENIKNNE